MDAVHLGPKQAQRVTDAGLAACRESVERRAPDHHGPWPRVRPP